MMSAGIELERYADRSLGRLGGNDFNHTPTPKFEADYRELRKKGDDELAEKAGCMRRAHEAYEQGDGASAKHLSNEGKRHAAEADKWYEEASKMIFNANNSHTAGDTIDLHGQSVEQALSILTGRIQRDQQTGQTHLHVIVGKGNHSENHIQKLKPAVEELCQELRLQYETEENAGRVYIDLQGGDVGQMPPLPPQPPTQHAGYGDRPYHSHQTVHHTGQQHQQHQQQQHQQHYGVQNQEEQLYDEIETSLTKLFKKYCCTVM
ncbi:DUF1771-domain-containing protein [Nemania serpens]|nr:DUF1771-domain-containing protein [Nemania serpens]